MNYCFVDYPVLESASDDIEKEEELNEETVVDTFSIEIEDDVGPKERQGYTYAAKKNVAQGKYVLMLMFLIFFVCDLFA